MSPMHAIRIIDRMPHRPEASDPRGWLFKPDHPRRIDDYIDFFGTGSARPLVPDPCGERLLEVSR